MTRCPHCGKCPHCGQGTAPYAQPRPQPRPSVPTFPPQFPWPQPNGITPWLYNLGNNAANPISAGRTISFSAAAGGVYQ